jgi:hypothetical protein
MEKVEKIIIYLAVFTILLYILRLFGVIRIDGGQILGYAFVFYGISSVYLSFGQNEKGLLVLGSVFFCLGVVLFVMNNFRLQSVERLIFPSVLLTASVSLLILYLDNTKNKTLLYAASGLLVITIVFAKIWGVISFSSFFSAIWPTVMGYWPIILILLFVLFLLRDSDF